MYFTNFDDYKYIIFIKNEIYILVKYNKILLD